MCNGDGAGGGVPMAAAAEAICRGEMGAGLELLRLRRARGEVGDTGGETRCAGDVACEAVVLRVRCTGGSEEAPLVAPPACVNIARVGLAIGERLPSGVLIGTRTKRGDAEARSRTQRNQDALVQSDDRCWCLGASCKCPVRACLGSHLLLLAVGRRLPRLWSTRTRERKPTAPTVREEGERGGEDRAHTRTHACEE